MAPKKAITTKPTSTAKPHHVIVRTYSAGVHFGHFAKRAGKEVTLTNSRRIWYWQGAFTLNALATNGPGTGSKISDYVQSITLTEAIEIIDCSDHAARVFEELKSWKP